MIGNQIAECNDPEATSHCIAGSIIYVMQGQSAFLDAMGMIFSAAQQLDQSTRYIGMFNDQHTHAEALAAFDLAIAMVEHMPEKSGVTAATIPS